MYKRSQSKQQLNSKKYYCFHFYIGGKEMASAPNVGSSNVRFCLILDHLAIIERSIKQILVQVWLCLITKPNWMIGVRLGLITEHSIRYTRFIAIFVSFFKWTQIPFSLEDFWTPLVTGWYLWDDTGKDDLGDSLVVMCWDVLSFAEVKFPKTYSIALEIQFLFPLFCSFLWTAHPFH